MTVGPDTNRLRRITRSKTCGVGCIAAALDGVVAPTCGVPLTSGVSPTFVVAIVAAGIDGAAGEPDVDAGATFTVEVEGELEDSGLKYTKSPPSTTTSASR